MKITVLNGSPKGEAGVTIQYVKYMQKRFPEHTFGIVNVAKEIGQIEKDRARFDSIVDDIADSDGVLWAFPLYVCVVHSNYMRFIELIAERDAESAFSGKYTAAFSTSIHFFDHTAHNYIHAVCDDLGMKYVGFFSAEMDDLIIADSRKKLEFFTQDFLSHIELKLPTQRLYAPIANKIPRYLPGPASSKTDNAGIKTLIIADIAEGDSNLAGMVDRLANSFTHPAELVNLRQANIKGGCLGCIRCGFKNECAYGDSDDIKALYNEKIRNAGIVIFAGVLKGRFLSSRFKMFMDRRFLNTHQPQMEGKQIAYVISGPLGENQNVLEVLQAVTEFDGANLAGIITDEYGASADVDAGVDSLAAQLVKAAQAGYVMPSTFLHVGGMKLFRDVTYGKLRFVFQADHRYYKKHGLYDFPQKQIGMRLTNAVMMLATKIPKVRKGMQGALTKFMLMPYKKILETPSAPYECASYNEKSASAHK